MPFISTTIHTIPTYTTRVTPPTRPNASSPPPFWCNKFLVRRESQLSSGWPALPTVQSESGTVSGSATPTSTPSGPEENPIPSPSPTIIVQSTDPAQSGTHTAPSTTVIAEIVVVSVLLTALAVGICIFLILRKRHHKHLHRMEEIRSTPITPTTNGSSRREKGVLPNNEGSNQPLQIGSLQHERRLGHPTTAAGLQNDARGHSETQRSQVALLQHWNEEMRNNIGRVMEHMQRLEGFIEPGARDVEGRMSGSTRSSMPDVPPPTYASLCCGH
ncbi:hypothetical protein F5876DRAFT_82477 [Lentinula aff. lateritia]|uniref:Uncharacterized protein n=1 Tax=Lentinula aff. lateritia TaxID=2804960 RepID=A0ACC1TK10_9AGAR|nr:hypothetical protein F5876DRAFT_82477 [Lentinula aff. lateritia]